MPDRTTAVAQEALAPEHTFGGRRRALLAGLMILVTLVVYIPAMRGGFIWDDDVMLTENPFIKGPGGLSHIWFSAKSPDYFPMTSTSLWLEWRLWGTVSTGYRLTNVLLHAACAVLIWLLLERLAIPGAWIAGLIFAVHPVNVASVAWITERKNTLSLLFYLLTILCYFRFERASRRRWYVISVALFLLALLSKTSVVMLPCVLLLCAWWQRGRIALKDVYRTLPFFVLSLILGLVTIWFQFHGVARSSDIEVGSLPARMAAGGCAVWFYLSKALVPWHLSMIYPRWNIDVSTVWVFVPGALILVALGVFWLRRRNWGRPLLFGLGYFAVTLAPVLGLFKMSLFRYSQVADHWQYVSLIGVVALACGLLTRAIAWRPRTAAVVVLAVASLCALTWSQNRTYRSPGALWRNALSVNPAGGLVNENLGAALMDEGSVKAAIIHLGRALQVGPESTTLHYNMAIALGADGRIDESIKQYEKALRLDPRDAKARYNFGKTLSEYNRLDEAIVQYQAALRINPFYVRALNDLGIALALHDKPREAAEKFREALKIEPDNARAHYNLAVVLVSQGDLDEAAGHLRAAVRVVPNDVEARSRLGTVLLRQGRSAEAADEFARVARLAPDSADAWEKLSEALTRLGRKSEAADARERAEQLKAKTR